jgi:glycine dehydrogenase subunit 2
MSLIFEHSRPGAQALTLPEPESATLPLAANWLRNEAPRLPEVSQLEVVRHFVNLSQKNHAIDKAFYPLGSCTMKYNPKVADRVAADPSFAQAHPLAPESTVQGSLAVMYSLQQLLADVTGFDAVTLQPAAGAQGEWVGMRMIKAYFDHRGESQRTEVLIPDSAHGTNPASAVMCGFTVKTLKTPENGLVDVEELTSFLSEKTAAVMLTNPNTLGLFERDILTISERVHAAGGLLYYDGANLNAIVGRVQPARMGFDVMHINTHKTFATPHGGGGPGCGPVAVNKTLLPFLPVPMVNFDGQRYFLEDDRPLSIGKVKLFYGNFEMMLRSLVYLLAYGGDGLAAVSGDAVLNANYLLARLKKTYHVAVDTVCKHEFVLTSERQKTADNHINTMAIAKRLLDYGYHPPTVYFPLIVPEAMMIEPTETESKATLDAFVAAMEAIAQECQNDPETVLTAPHTTPVGRVDEVGAARNPVLGCFSCQ